VVSSAANAQAVRPQSRVFGGWGSRPSERSRARDPLQAVCLLGEKGKIVVTGNMKVRLDADSHAERAKVFNGAKTGISFYFKGKDIETSIPEMMLNEFPYGVLSNFTHEENGPSVDAGIEYKAIKPKGTNYNDFMSIILVTRDGQLY